MSETSFEMVAGPYPAESRTMTSPPAATAVIAAPKLRHGAVLLHGFVSKPVDATNVLCANTFVAKRTAKRMIRRVRMMFSLFECDGAVRGAVGAVAVELIVPK